MEGGRRIGEEPGLHAVAVDLSEVEEAGERVGVGDAQVVGGQDPDVSTILINIFAGINRCDWVAEGIVAAFEQLKIQVPVVVRLSGTNVEEGTRILDASGLPIQTAGTLAEAAEMAVAAAEEPGTTVAPLGAWSKEALA